MPCSAATPVLATDAETGLSGPFSSSRQLPLAKQGASASSPPAARPAAGQTRRGRRPRRQQRQIVRCGMTEVYFANISDSTIEAYVATGEPLRCAGSFALEGKGGMFVEKIEGCHSNVIGLSLPLLYQMLENLGYNVTNFWQ